VLSKRALVAGPTFTAKQPVLYPNESSDLTALRRRAWVAVTTYRKVTGGFRSDWDADLFAGVRFVIGAAARRGVGAHQAISLLIER
jgi:hypothetical protein